jgi:hypothetical protein
MKIVQSIPDPVREATRDPWFDQVLVPDGQIRVLEHADWSERYVTIASAQSAVRQAAQARELEIERIARRGDELSVQLVATQKPKAPSKRVAKKANSTAKKAPAKRAAPKASTTPPGAR